MKWYFCDPFCVFPPYPLYAVKQSLKVFFQRLPCSRLLLALVHFLLCPSRLHCTYNNSFSRNTTIAAILITEFSRLRIDFGAENNDLGNQFLQSQHNFATFCEAQCCLLKHAIPALTVRCWFGQYQLAVPWTKRKTKQWPTCDATDTAAALHGHRMPMNHKLFRRPPSHMIGIRLRRTRRGRHNRRRCPPQA